jgi:GNAT superfamily N-acetyltransferase
MSIRIQDITKIPQQEYDLMINTVYNNFAYLVNYNELNHSRSNIKKLFDEPTFYGLLLYDDNNNILIGYLIGKIDEMGDGKRVFFISYIYIGSAYRSHGYGNILLKRLKTVVKNIIGLNFIALCCVKDNILAHKFYYKNGFKIDTIYSFMNQVNVLLLYL